MAKLITDVMRELRNGRGVAIASDMLNEVVRAVQATGKAGSVTIKIKIEPDEEGEGAQMFVAMDCSKKVPTPDIPTGVFYANRDGDLVRVDPNQPELFKEAEAGAERRAPIAAAPER